MVWWAYRIGLIRWVDLRTWFACWELVSRRCEVKANEPRRYEVTELEGLVGGVGGKRIPVATRRTESLRRLERAGLIAWSSSAIQFPASPDRMPVEDLSDFWAMYQRIENRKRRVPVPRRIVREIAAGFAPVVVATILGHLLRCLYFSKQRGWQYEGCCKSTFVAEVFGVDERGVRRARKHLEEIGWLSLEESDHWHRQRYGGRAVINWAWSRPVNYESRPPTELPGRTAELPAGLPCPVPEEKLSSRLKNQKPASRGPTGVFNGKDLKKTPTMRHVEPWDLKDTGRLLQLFEDAQRLSLVGGGYGDQLLFVAAAERALMKGTMNPCGFFVRVVRSKLWHHVTNGDEDAAHERLKKHFYGHEEKRKREPVRRARAPRIELSGDARLVQAVRHIVAKKRISGDPFHVLRADATYRDWTRERWDTAVGELENARLRQFQANASAREDPVAW
ncbi:MAG: hypothetical protein KJ749_01770 [Planctomycetes bacterium]|nr:hypothetical protein [Planctomycetota bacterium]